jgi:hypothetical protein
MMEALSERQQEWRSEIDDATLLALMTEESHNPRNSNSL